MARSPHPSPSKTVPCSFRSQNRAVWWSVSPTRPARELAPAAPSSGLLSRAFRLVHVKLNGCGTHMEQIVYVHDLFRRVGHGAPQPGETRSMLTRKQAELLRFIHE